MTTSSQFDLIDMFAGKNQATMCVLFVDMLGTSDIIIDGARDNIIAQKRVADRHCQFINVLGVLNQTHPNVYTHQVSDCAFVYSLNLGELIDFATSLFKNMTKGLDNSKYTNYLLRGAIGCGQIQLCDDNRWQKICPNFHYCPMIGIGNVEAANLEKRGSKGSRLFVSQNATSLIHNKNQHKLRACNEKDIDCFEINWMCPDSSTKGLSYLNDIDAIDNEHFDNTDDMIFNNVPMIKCLHRHASRLKQRDELRVIGMALDDVIKWAVE